MDATELKAALIRAGVTQTELAERLHRTRGVVAGWVAADRVPDEYARLVYDALGIPAPASPLTTYSDEELLDELRHRLDRAHMSASERSKVQAPEESAAGAPSRKAARGWGTEQNNHTEVN